MKTITLYGHLGKQFGRRHQFEVATPAEAIRALCSNYKGFAQAIANGQWRIRMGKIEQALEDINHPIQDEIKIIPVVAGSGGLGKIILGAALIAASFYLPGMTYFSAYSSFGINASSIAMGLGTSLVLSGVSQVLFAPPKASNQSRENVENLPSYIFNGAVNTTGQGNPVPLCYGRLRVGSQVISAGLHSESL